MRKNDFEYFERRAKEEAERALAAKHDVVAAVHRAFADAYRSQASGSANKLAL